MAGQHVELDEGARVEEDLEPLTGGELAPGVLTLDRRRAAGVERLLLELGQLLDPLVERVRGHVARRGLVAVECFRFGLGLDIGLL